MSNAITRSIAIANYRLAHIDAKNTIAFAIIRIKHYYNLRHQSMYFDIKDIINLRLHKDYNVLNIISHKIEAQFADPFEITKRINKLAYRLKLSNNIRIYNVVFVAMLKSLLAKSNLYRRRLSLSDVVVIDSKNEYVIKKLIRKRRIRRGREWFM